MIKGKARRFSKYYAIRLVGWERAKRFAELIGFRVSHGRERLEYLLELKKHPQGCVAALAQKIREKEREVGARKKAKIKGKGTETRPPSFE